MLYNPKEHFSLLKILVLGLLFFAEIPLPYFQKKKKAHISPSFIPVSKGMQGDETLDAIRKGKQF